MPSLLDWPLSEMPSLLDLPISKTRVFQFFFQEAEEAGEVVWEDHIEFQAMVLWLRRITAEHFEETFGVIQ